MLRQRARSRRRGSCRSRRPRARCRAASAPGSAARRCGCCSDLTEACARPASVRPALIAWVTLVLPTEPVTAPRRAWGARSRAATPSASSALQRVVDHHRRAARPAARPARRPRRLAMRLRDELMAVAHAAPGPRTGRRARCVRVSMETPVAAKAAPASRPPVAAAISSEVQSGSAMARSLQGLRRSRPRRRTDGPRRRRSGPAHGPCRPPPGRRRRPACAAAARIASRRSPISCAPGRAGQDLGADRGGVFASADCRR